MEDGLATPSPTPQAPCQPRPLADRRSHHVLSTDPAGGVTGLGTKCLPLGPGSQLGAFGGGGGSQGRMVIKGSLDSRAHGFWEQASAWGKGEAGGGQAGGDAGSQGSGVGGWGAGGSHL